MDFVHPQVSVLTRRPGTWICKASRPEVRDKSRWVELVPPVLMDLKGNQRKTEIHVGGASPKRKTHPTRDTRPGPLPPKMSANPTGSRLSGKQASLPTSRSKDKVTKHQQAKLPGQENNATQCKQERRASRAKQSKTSSFAS